MNKHSSGCTFIVILFVLACLLGIITNIGTKSSTAAIDEPTRTIAPTKTLSPTKTIAPTRTSKPTPVILTVQAGTLAQYKDQITKDAIVNVYKVNGILDSREDDLKELCLDWLYFREKIIEYAYAGQDNKASENRNNFELTNSALNEYNENDIEVMLSILEAK